MSAFLARFLIAGSDLDEVRFHRLVERFHKLGPRALAEFLDEIGASYLRRQTLEQRLTEYVERLDPEVLKDVGGDRLPPAPVHRININRGDDDQ